MHMNLLYYTGSLRNKTEFNIPDQRGFGNISDQDFSDEDSKDSLLEAIPNQAIIEYRLNLFLIEKNKRPFYSLKEQTKPQRIELFDAFIVHHSKKVGEYCYNLGRVLGVDPKKLEEIKLAGILHDIGKSVLPRELLHTKNRINSSQWEIIKTHSDIGYEVLRHIKGYENIAIYITYHHERYDGQGYPMGLIGNMIPLESRILSIADAYEAMTSNRPYSKALSKEEAIEELIRNSGTQFDDNLVEKFIKEVL